MSPRAAGRVRAGINAARRDSWLGREEPARPQHPLEARAYDRVRYRYLWASLVGWPMPQDGLPPVPPRRWGQWTCSGPVEAALARAGAR